MRSSMNNKGKIFLTASLTALLLVFTNTNVFADMGGSKFSKAPCTTKGNSIAQTNSLKSPKKQAYCIALTGKLTLVFSSYISWAEAKTDAIVRGGKLTGINSQEEQELVDSALISNNDYPNVWLSGVDSTGNGTWVWEDSNTQFASGFKDLSNYQTLTGKFANWEPNDPNNQGTENCVVAAGGNLLYGRSDALWVNLTCDANGYTHAYLMRTK